MIYKWASLKNAQKDRTTVPKRVIMYLWPTLTQRSVALWKQVYTILRACVHRFSTRLFGKFSCWTSSNILAIRQYSCGYFPCQHKNYARKSAYFTDEHKFSDSIRKWNQTLLAHCISCLHDRLLRIKTVQFLGRISFAVPNDSKRADLFHFWLCSKRWG